MDAMGSVLTARHLRKLLATAKRHFDTFIVDLQRNELEVRSPNKMEFFHRAVLNEVAVQLVRKVLEHREAINQRLSESMSYNEVC